MIYQAKNFEPLLGVPGFSAKLLKDHFKLYEGYVAAANRLAERLGRPPARHGADAAEREALRRRFVWEFNGMRLHELYFENLAPKGGGRQFLLKDVRAAAFKRKLEADFGGLDAWESDFLEVGGQRGIGWAVLYFDPASRRFFNAWINEHDGGHPAGCVPVLVMDVFEHAYLHDYGLDRASYMGAFLRAADWGAAVRRQERLLVVEAGAL